MILRLPEILEIMPTLHTALLSHRSRVFGPRTIGAGKRGETRVTTQLDAAARQFVLPHLLMVRNPQPNVKLHKLKIYF